MADSLQTVVNDPEFAKLSPAAQRQVAEQVEPALKSLSAEGFSKVIGQMRSPVPVQDIAERLVRSTTAPGNPIESYLSTSIPGMVQGAKAMGQGQIASGFNQIFSSLGKPMTVAAIPAAVMNPPAALAALAAGTGGYMAGRGGASLLGASPETAEAIGNVASIPSAALGGSVGGRLYMGEPRLPSMPSMVSKMAPKEEGIGIHIDPMNPLSWAYYGLRKLSGLRLKQDIPTHPTRPALWRDFPEPSAESHPDVIPILPEGGILPSGRRVGPAPQIETPPPEPRIPIWSDIPQPVISPPPLIEPIPGVLPSGRMVGPAPTPPPLPARVALWKSLTGSETPPPDVSAVMPTPTPPAKLPSGRVPGKPPIEGETVPPVTQQTTPQNIPPIELPKGHVAVAIPPELIDYPEYHQMVLSHGPNQTLRAFESDVPVAQYLKGRGVTPEVWKAADLAERNSMLKGYSDAVKKRHYPMQEVMPKGAVGRTASDKSEHIYNLLNREWGRVGPFIPTGE